MKKQLKELASLDLSDLIVAVDFDGTCVTHVFSDIGEDVPGAVDVLTALAEAGAKIILWTMRSDKLDICVEDGPNKVPAAEYLSDAAKWFADRGIKLHAINNNPQQSSWTSSPKCYAHIYIDDAALGCPLVHDEHDRPYVDWPMVLNLLLGVSGGK